MSRSELAATFEATYPRYPFAPLVRLAINFGEWLRKIRFDASERGQGGEIGEAA